MIIFRYKITNNEIIKFEEKKGEILSKRTLNILLVI